MLYVVDQWGQYIQKFTDREEAERYCEKWNERFPFSKWTTPKAHVEEAE